jgi:predicted XRE-type DNA-binding protein
MRYTKTVSKNPHIGSTLEDFLREEGIFEDATNYAIKRVLAWQVEKAMRDQGITKVEMARRMGTSRAHLNRLLDPENDKVQLDTVQRAAAAIGRKVRMELV